MELSGLESPTSWVRFRICLAQKRLDQVASGTLSYSPNTFPNKTGTCPSVVQQAR
jgi:hypothetical protein